MSLHGDDCKTDLRHCTISRADTYHYHHDRQHLSCETSRHQFLKPSPQNTTWPAKVANHQLLMSYGSYNHVIMIISCDHFLYEHKIIKHSSIINLGHSHLSPNSKILKEKFPTKKHHCTWTLDLAKGHETTFLIPYSFEALLMFHHKAA